jgi:hypothetical protein
MFQGKKKVADRLPLSGPPLAFFVTPNLPLSGRIEPQRKTLRAKRSSILLFVKQTIHFFVKILRNWDRKWPEEPG